jgi:membrane-bound ClpP family serine protease
MAAHVAAMAGTNIGAAHPVSMGGGKMSREMTEKRKRCRRVYPEYCYEKERNRMGRKSGAEVSPKS